MSRPALGGETKVELALVDLTARLDLSALPTVGAFEEISCTYDVNLAPPTQTHIPVPNGYNPSAQLIPGVKTNGELSMTGNWKPEGVGVEDKWNGQLCVARLTTTYQDTWTVAAQKVCAYFRPAISVQHPQLDGISTFRMGGQFHLFGGDGIVIGPTGPSAFGRLVLIDTITNLPVIYVVENGQFTKL